MPHGDRTGPLGQGPRTGRGAGYCSGNTKPGYMTPRGFQQPVINTNANVSANTNVDANANASEKQEQPAPPQQPEPFIQPGRGRMMQGQRGRGRGRGRQAGQAPDFCVCPNCGAEVAHQRGISCRQQTCPQCGAAMVRA